MKSKIQVLSVEHREGRSKTGNDYSLHICQCIVTDVDSETGIERPLIGELILPKGHDVVTAGMYEGEFGISVGQDKRIGGRLIKLTPLAAAARSAASVPPASASPQKPQASA